MNSVKAKLIAAEQIAQQLFDSISQNQLIQAGKSEKELNHEIYKLAEANYGITKYWHKRIVRSGSNTLFPYEENPPNLILQEDDILFIDFGPILDEWEADFGRTFVIGNDINKLNLKTSVEQSWYEAKQWFDEKTELTGAQFWNYIVDLASKKGYEFGGQLAGHLIGHFPHESLNPNNYNLYIHPENHNDLFLPDKNGEKREWILEIHFVDKTNKIGGFFEQLLT